MEESSINKSSIKESFTKKSSHLKKKKFFTYSEILIVLLNFEEETWFVSKIQSKKFSSGLKYQKLI